MPKRVTGNVALTCRYYGISRTLFYTWRRHMSRTELEHLVTALEAVLDGEGSPLPPLTPP
jgi:transposase-like protein